MLLGLAFLEQKAAPPPKKKKQREDIRDKKSRRRRRHKRGKDYGCLSMTAGVEMEMAESQVIQLERVTVSRKKK